MPASQSLGVTLLRWLSVPLSAGAVAAGTVIGARAWVAAADERCAQVYMVGGTCVAAWHTDLVENVIYAAMVVIGLGLATLPALLAPHFARTISVLLWLLTSATIAAIFIATGWRDLALPLVIAITSGAVGVAWIWNRSGKSQR